MNPKKLKTSTKHPRGSFPSTRGPAIPALLLHSSFRAPPPAGGGRRVLEKLDTLCAPPWRTCPAHSAFPWFGLAVALCLHAFGVAALALWQEPDPIDGSEVYEVTILPEILPVDACPAPPDSGDEDGTTDNTGPESAAATEEGYVLSNYWDIVRAAIAGRVRYPRDAVRQGIEGTIDLRLSLDAQGGLVAVVPLERSPELLIQSAERAVRLAAPFPPNTNGPSGVVSAILPVHFQLNRNPERSSLE